MDIYNETHSGQFVQLLIRQKVALETARARQGEHPKDRRSRLELVANFTIQYARQQLRQLKASEMSNLCSSFVPPPYKPSTVPLAKLKQMFIKDLRLETHHRSNYLLLRSITPPNRMTAVMAIAEDETKDAVMIQLYRQDIKMDRPITSILDQGDVFIVKEPYFKVMADGEYGLRVDHVSDLVKVEPHDQRVPLQWSPRISNPDKTADDWKVEGNEAMRRQKYWMAIQSYTAALECPISAQELKTVRLNRALAYLKNDCFDAALIDTGCLTSPSDAPEKALYRASEALYRLGKFSECREILMLLCKKYPDNGDAAVGLTQVRGRIEEQESGTYNFRAIYEQVSKLRPPHLDHATFIGPVVVKASKGRGRGLFTTKAVKAGDLILCEKAFAHCYASTAEEEAVSCSKTTLLINVHTDQITLGTGSDLITTVVQKLWRNPSTLPLFTSLHHGSYIPVDVTEVDSKPIIDTFLIERIISFNVFGCPLSSYNDYSKPAEIGKRQHHSCGIWLKASYINHSCFSNVQRSFIGDLQLVRATRDLPADTELKFWYNTPAFGGYEETQKGLQQWGFKCDCAICLDAKNTPKKLLTRRKALLGDLKTVPLNPTESDQAKAERLLAAIELTYKSPSSKVPRLALCSPYLHLTRAYAAQSQAAKVVSLALRVLESLGFVIEGAHVPVSSSAPFVVVHWGVMVDKVIETWIHLWTAYASVAPHLCPGAEECARTSYRICVGEDVTFEESYGEMARQSIRA